MSKARITVDALRWMYGKGRARHAAIEFLLGEVARLRAAHEDTEAWAQDNVCRLVNERDNLQQKLSLIEGRVARLEKDIAPKRRVGGLR